MLDFIAVDFETANSKRDACAIGVVLYQDGHASRTYYTLINPHRKFDANCTAVHGISAADVKDAPAWPDVYDFLLPLFRHYPSVSHNASFDYAVFVGMCEKCGLAVPNLTWYDSCDLFRQNRPGLSSYRLNYLCEYLGLSLQHHNAISDAEACGQLFLMLLHDESTAIYPAYPRPHVSSSFYSDESPSDSTDDTPDTVEIHFDVPEKTLDPVFVTPDVTFDDVEISLLDSTICITGEAPDIPRADLISAAQNCGARVVSAISRKVDYVFIGCVDLSLVGDKSTYKTHKVIDAEAYHNKYGKPYLFPISSLVDALHLEGEPANEPDESLSTL